MIKMGMMGKLSNQDLNELGVSTIRAKHRLRSPTTKKAGNLATILLAISRSNYTSFISRILVS